VIQRHSNRVYCTVCHIPSFAKYEATDMHRDWSRNDYHEDTDKFEPAITFNKDVKPVYAWWNGKGAVQIMDKPVKIKEGKIKLYDPQGSINDPGSMIYAFKLHTARLPVDRETQKLIPIKVGIVFKKGDSDAAVRAGAREFFGKESVQYDWRTTERYMGIFHEVSPKEKALQCTDCHHPAGRLKWTALGYKNDPRGK
jgi:hypothetical protein